MSSDHPWIVHLISHTHWDREWYMGFEQYRWRLVKLLDRLLAVYDDNPAFRAFLLDGQVSALKDYLEMRTEREADVRRAVTAGRLQIGPWFTQPHETLASGEAIIRNLQLGIRESRRFGEVMMISYNADQFGHVAQMPQIVRGAGIADVVGWRGIPQGSKCVFNWQGADGSRVRMWYVNAGYGDSKALPLHLDNAAISLDGSQVTVEGLRARVEELVNSRGPNAITAHLLSMNGVDHAFAQENVLEVVAAMNAHIPGIQAVHSTLPDYLSAVQRACAEAETPLPTLVGELFDPSETVLPDVHSTHPDQKRANGVTEDALERWAEPFAALAWLAGSYPYPQAQLDKAWEYLLLNHAHDSQACSSLDSIYRAVMYRYQCANEIIQAVIGDSLQGLCNLITPAAMSEATVPMVLFNPLGWTRNDVTTATIDVPHALGITAPALFDAMGEYPLVIHGWEDTSALRFNPFCGFTHLYPVRRYHVSFDPGEVPALGYKCLRLGNGAGVAPTTTPLFQTPNILENELLRVTIHPNGSFDLCRKTDGTHYSGLHLFEESGEVGDGFEHKAPQRDEIFDSRDAQAEMTVLCNTPVQATVEIRMIMRVPTRLADDRQSRSAERTTCTITSRLTLKAGSSRLDIETIIDNQACDHRIRVLFPTGLTSGRLRVAQPFDVVSRPIVPADTAAHAQQLFIDLHDDAQGLLIANLGIYEYAMLHHGRTAALTLLRGTDCIYECFRDVADLRIPQAQCLGEYKYTYSLIPYGADVQTAEREAYHFRYPMQPVLRRELEEETMPWFTPPTVDARFAESGSFVQVTPDSVMISAIKRQDERNSLIIRVVNYANTSVLGRLRLTIPGCTVTHAYLVNLLEERQQALGMDVDNGLSISVHGKGIVTIELCGEFPLGC